MPPELLVYLTEGNLGSCDRQVKLKMTDEFRWLSLDTGHDRQNEPGFSAVLLRVNSGGELCFSKPL